MPAPTPLPSYAPTAFAPEIVVTVATALVMDDVDPDAFNANVAAVDAFRRAVASSLASVASADDVVNGNELLCFHGCTRAHSTSLCSRAIHLPFV